jgi:hypothetical protein
MPGGYLNQVRMSVGTTGTGTLALSSAISPFLTFSQAGATDQMSVEYSIVDTTGGNSEKGTGRYLATGSSTSGPALARDNVFVSTNSNALVSFSSNAQVFVDPSAGGYNSSLVLGAHANLGGL